MKAFKPVRNCTYNIPSHTVMSFGLCVVVCPPDLTQRLLRLGENGYFFSVYRHCTLI